MKAVFSGSILCFLFVAGISAQGTFQTLVAPIDAASNEGNSRLSSPFGGRQQFVYGASEFSSLSPSGGGWLRRVDFRIDTPMGGVGASANVTNLEIRASTTLQTASSLSPVFSQNIGPNDTLIVGPSELHVNSPHVSGLSPQPFGLYGVTFPPQAFWYDPSQGNLLLDFSGPLGSYGGANALDAWQVAGYPVGSVRGTYGSASGTVSGGALVAQFTFEVVPEPSSIAFLLLGAGALICAKKFRKKP